MTSLQSNIHGFGDISKYDIHDNIVKEFDVLKDKPINFNDTVEKDSDTKKEKKDKQAADSKDSAMDDTENAADAKQSEKKAKNKSENYI